MYFLPYCDHARLDFDATETWISIDKLGRDCVLQNLTGHQKTRWIQQTYGMMNFITNQYKIIAVGFIMANDLIRSASVIFAVPYAFMRLCDYEIVTILLYAV